MGWIIGPRQKSKEDSMGISNIEQGISNVEVFIGKGSSDKRILCGIF